MSHPTHHARRCIGKAAKLDAHLRMPDVCSPKPSTSLLSLRCNPNAMGRESNKASAGYDVRTSRTWMVAMQAERAPKLAEAAAQDAAHRGTLRTDLLAYEH